MKSSQVDSINFYDHVDLTANQYSFEHYNTPAVKISHKDDQATQYRCFNLLVLWPGHLDQNHQEALST